MSNSHSLSTLSGNRLAGNAVPDDLAILYEHRGELREISAMEISADAHWQPWDDCRGRRAMNQEDAQIQANVNAVLAVKKCINFIAAAEDSHFFGYWRGPNETPLDRSPIVWYDNEGLFHLMPGKNLADAIVCYYSHDEQDFEEWKRWMDHWGIEIPWSSVDQMSNPVASVDPSDFHDHLYRIELEKLPASKPWWQFW